MGRGTRGQFAAFAAVASLLFTDYAEAAVQPDWSGSLAPPSSGDGRQPGEPLKVTIPESVPDATIEWLALEVDADDVSKMVSLQGRTVVYAPPRPLAAGEHVVRLVQYDETGKIAERGSWTFMVAAPSLLDRLSIDAQASIKGSNLLDSGDIPQEELPESKTQITGAAALKIEGGGERLGAGVQADAMYYSREEFSTSGQDSAEIGDFFAKARGGPLSLAFGHHAVEPESLLIQAFNRRGVSADLRLFDEGVVATGFMMRTDPIQGFRNGIGLDGAEKTVYGSVITLRPFPKKGWLTLTTSLLQGEGSDEAGDAVAGEPTASEGDSWGIAADAKVWGERLVLRGEYAGTGFDFDGPTGAAGREKDKGYLLLASVQPAFGSALGLKVGAQYRWVGPFFHSIANSTLPADIESARGTLGLSRGGFSLEGSAGRDGDNVVDSPLLPTHRRDFYAAAAAYRLGDAADAPGGIGAILGQLALGASYQHFTNEDIRLPEGAASPAASAAGSELKLSVGSAYGLWGWSAAHTIGEKRVEGGAPGDTDSQLTEAAVNLRIGSRLSVDLRGQQGRTESGAQPEDRTQLAGANVNVELMKDRLSFTVGYQYSRNWAADGSRDIGSHLVQPALCWRVMKARNILPAVELSLTGEYLDQADERDAAADLQRYQAFLNFTVAWGASRPGIN